MDLAGHGLHIRHDLAQSGGAGGLVKAGGVGGHLTEELVLGFAAFRKLRAIIPLRVHAANAGLAVAVEEHHGQTSFPGGDLAENIGVAHMGGVAGPGGVQPVRGGVIVPRHWLSDGSAGGEHSLFGNHQRAVRNLILYFTLRPLGNRGGRAVICGRVSAARQQGEGQHAAYNHRGPSEFVFHQNFLLL